MRVNGGGHVAQVYAIRQAISKALVAYYQKCKQSVYQLHVHLYILYFYLSFYVRYSTATFRNILLRL